MSQLVPWKTLRKNDDDDEAYWFLKWGGGQESQLHLSREEKEVRPCGNRTVLAELRERQSTWLAHGKTREFQDVSKDSIPSCWLQSGLRCWLSLPGGTTGGFRAGKWHDVCSWRLIFKKFLSNSCDQQDIKPGFKFKSSDSWSRALPTQVHGHFPDLDVLGTLFFLSLQELLVLSWPNLNPAVTHSPGMWLFRTSLYLLANHL